MENQLKVFYDGNCSLCRATIDKISKKDTDNKITFISIQTLKPAELPTNKEDLLSKMHCISHNKLYNGVDAFIEVFSNIEKYKSLLLVLKFAKKIGIGEKFYELISKNRKLFPLDKCNKGNCEI